MMFDGAVQKGALEVSIKAQIGSVALSHIQIIVRHLSQGIPVA